MVNDDLWIGILLVDAAAAACEAFGTDVGVIYWVDASDLSATALETTMRPLPHLLPRGQTLFFGHVGSGQ